MRFKRLCILILSLCISLFPIEAENTAGISGDYPKVAVVLSGGSAMGFAHIGVLREVEKAGIPIDIVVGTSMGGLIAGLYASGYSPKDMEDLAKSINWAAIFTYPNSFLTYHPGPVIDTHKILVSFSFDSTGIGKTLGVLPDQQIINELSRRLIRVSDIRDFDQLPVQFRCVAVDLISGEEKVFDTGMLVQALRSTIALPGLLAPYPVDGRYYIDGGISNNLPVSTARGVGADIVIAVNVSSPPPESIDELRSAADVAVRSTNIMVNNNEAANETDSDLLITPDMEGLEMTEFWRSSEFIERGHNAAAEFRDQLLALAESISEYRPLDFPDPDRTGSYFSIPVKKVRTVEQCGLCSTSLPLDFFKGVVDLPLTDEVLDRLELRINQVITSGSYESIAFALGRISSSENEEYALQLFPVTINRGRHSLNAGFTFNASFSGAAGSPWYISPGFNTSLKFTKLFASDAYMLLDVSIEDSLNSSFRFFLPLTSGVFLTTHLQGGEERFITSEETSPEIVNRVSFFEIGLMSGYRFNNFLEIGLDALVNFQWHHKSTGAESGILQDFELIPLVVPTLTWENCPPSNFTHEGIRSNLQLAFSFDFSKSWYHRLKIAHEQFLPLSLNGTLFYDFRYGSYRGKIVSPRNYFDLGGWDGLPGLISEDQLRSDVLLAGVGYRQRMPLVSKAIGMDSYYMGHVRLGTGYDDFPGWSQLPVQVGAAAGIGLSTVMGDLVLGIGVNNTLDIAYYLLFN